MCIFAHRSAQVALDVINERRLLTRFSYDMLAMDDLCFGKALWFVFHAMYYKGLVEVVKNYFEKNEQAGGIRTPYYANLPTRLCEQDLKEVIAVHSKATSARYWSC